MTKHGLYLGVQIFRWCKSILMLFQTVPVLPFPPSPKVIVTCKKFGSNLGGDTSGLDS